MLLLLVFFNEFLNYFIIMKSDLNLVTKAIIAVAVLLSMSTTLWGQDSSVISLLDESQLEVKQEGLRQRLVELALQNSDKKIAELQEDASKDLIGVAKAGWLNSLFASSYWNEYSISPPDKEQFNLYYPKYNFGVNIPLGIFITVPKNVKIAKKNYQIAIEQKKLKELSIKNQVLSKFEDYLMINKQLTIQSLVTVNEQNAFRQSEQKFRSGEIQIEEYNLAMKKYNEELMRKITLQHDLALVKLSIEELIGVDLDSLLK